MALSMKNTLTSLTLSGVMLFAAYLSGNQAIPFNGKDSAESHQNALMGEADAAAAPLIRKKTRRAFTAPYFSFGKSNITAGVRQ